MKRLPFSYRRKGAELLRGMSLFQVRKALLDCLYSNIETAYICLMPPITCIGSTSPFPELFQKMRFDHFRMRVGTLSGLFNLRSEGFPQLHPHGQEVWIPSRPDRFF